VHEPTSNAFQDDVRLPGDVVVSS